METNAILSELQKQVENILKETETTYRSFVDNGMKTEGEIILVQRRERACGMVQLAKALLYENGYPDLGRWVASKWNNVWNISFGDIHLYQGN